MECLFDHGLVRMEQVTEDDIQIDTKCIGAVIGHRGRTLQKLEAEFAARIRVQQNGIVIIRAGTLAAIEGVKREIVRICGQNSANFCRMRGLSDRHLAALGSPRGSSWLRDELELQYGCQIELAPKEVFISCPNDAKANMLEIEGKIRHQLSIWFEHVQQRLQVHRDCPLSRIFDDQALSLLAEREGLKIEPLKEDNWWGVVLEGGAKAVEEAASLIGGLVSGQSLVSLPLVTGFFSAVETSVWRDILRDVRYHIEIPFQLRVVIDRDANQINLCSERPTSPHTLASGLRVLQELLLYFFPQNVALFFVLPKESLDSVCGRQDSSLDRMQRADCVVWHDAATHSIWFAGTARSVAAGLNRLESNRQEWLRSNQVISLKHGDAIGRLIGTNGSTLREVQLITQTVISVNPDSVLISAQAPESNLTGAVERVRELLATGSRPRRL